MGNFYRKKSMTYEKNDNHQFVTWRPVGQSFVFYEEWAGENIDDCRFSYVSSIFFDENYTSKI